MVWEEVNVSRKSKKFWEKNSKWLLATKVLRVGKSKIIFEDVSFSANNPNTMFFTRTSAGSGSSSWFSSWSRSSWSQSSWWLYHHDDDHQKRGRLEAQAQWGEWIQWITSHCPAHCNQFMIQYIPLQATAINDYHSIHPFLIQYTTIHDTI